MIPEEICKKLSDRFGDQVVEADHEVLDPFVKIQPQVVHDVAAYLAGEKDLAFDSLMSLSGVDLGAEEQLSVVYHLYSMIHRCRIVIKADLPRDNPSLQTVSDLWPAANWHERETYDLFGVKFEGHPDPRRILLPDDWEGYPLRKDYQTPETYRGMTVPYPEDKDPDRGFYVFQENGGEDK